MSKSKEKEERLQLLKCQVIAHENFFFLQEIRLEEQMTGNMAIIQTQA